MYYVYILINAKGILYKGCTADLKARLLAHNAGKVSSTKSAGPWTLIYYQAFVNKTDARREEIFLKSGKGRARLQYVLENTLKL